ncbi:SDR family NAD(P)-dependent oxidoreductase [Amycolatopsis magusensis]|uniref:NAD(P)-dependent dehydrogenase (Short-subunit alcohol dehydrogenase family) n=1 Tax=Amycolatopsis magusensis TaxID=882444 RepID=A0ABS4Q783_9PSEU|nr:SDR family oxidoreductase [Amycolatopsis magusensis]MBP2186953.1 NAD(P)-dependent dehydrogenase (short-subunit alcohol dehydrogenase family) [Amycolatopsis magusensis]MDI5975109.1 SDR family oxidoreductase [Amycolatopsis magusensis]
MNGLLEQKAVVVTGGGRGLGQAFAVHAAQAGAAVVVNDVDVEFAERTAEGIRAQGGRAVASGHSVADPKQARAIVDRCVAEYGRIDGLVSNAGVNYEALPWQEDPDQVRELIEVNVLGVVYTGMAAAEAMVAQGGGGSIVNISSGASLGQRKLGVYAASKGAVASLTYSWALDLEEVGIRVNAVCPLAHTRMVWKSERSLRNCPPDRTPSRIAPLVLFLLGENSAGITGQMIRCNGPQLHLVGQPHFKAPILERDVWDTESVERAFDEVFSAHLEPYGLEKRVPPKLRKWTENPLRTA